MNIQGVKHFDTGPRPACICRTASKRLIKFGVKCMRVYYNMLNVTKHAYISSCLNDADASRAWGDIQLTRHARLSCMRGNIKSWCKRYIRRNALRSEPRALTDGSVAQDGDLARFRLRHLYLFPTTSISTCKRACAVWKKRNHMDLIRYIVTASWSLNGIR